MKNEESKITAQYVNGLAVAVVATVSAAYLAGNVPGGFVVIGAMTSFGLHLMAIWITRRSAR